LNYCAVEIVKSTRFYCIDKKILRPQAAQKPTEQPNSQISSPKNFQVTNGLAYFVPGQVKKIKMFYNLVTSWPLGSKYLSYEKLPQHSRTLISCWWPLY
jgi:hypothetical protein